MQKLVDIWLDVDDKPLPVEDYMLKQETSKHLEERGGPCIESLNTN